MNDYFYKKSKYYYDMFKKGKLVKKVCAFIKNDKNEFLVIVSGVRPTNVGGSVDPGEKTSKAILREVLEETGVACKSAKYITKHYYSVNWKFEDVEFPNRRIESFYVCELDNNNVNIIGLDGEFENGTKLEWHTLSELEEMGINKFEYNIMKTLDK